MQYKAKKTTALVFRIMAIACVVLLVLGVLGFVYKQTNGFTSEFKTFYVTCNGKKYTNTANECELIPHVEQRFDVEYPLAIKKKGYTVSVVPNAKQDAAFYIVSDGQNYPYKDAGDLTKGFDIDLHETYFTVTANKEMSEILRLYYPKLDTDYIPQAFYSGIRYFTLVVTSADASNQVRINFCVGVNIAWNDEGLVFV